MKCKVNSINTITLAAKSSYFISNNANQFIFLEALGGTQISLNRTNKFLISINQVILFKMGSLKYTEIFNPTDSPVVIKFIVSELYEVDMRNKNIIIINREDIHCKKLLKYVNKIFLSETMNKRSLSFIEKYAFKFLQCIQLQSDKTKPSKKYLDTRLIIIHRYIRNNYTKLISLNELSELIDCTPNYLCSTYSRVFGISPMHHVNTLRIKAAVALLLKDNLSVSMVAKQVGYNSSPQFCALFKRFKGITPSQYRSMMLENEFTGNK